MRRLYLFAGPEILNVLSHRREELKEECSRLDSSTLESVPEPELVRDLSAKYKLELPVLQEDQVEMSHREVDVDVSRGFSQ